MNHLILVNGDKVNIIDDITDNNLNHIRLKKIKEIFKKYS